MLLSEIQRRLCRLVSWLTKLFSPMRFPAIASMTLALCQPGVGIALEVRLFRAGLRWPGCGAAKPRDYHVLSVTRCPVGRHGRVRPRRRLAPRPGPFVS